jgi:hypothetical protein
MSVIGSAPGDRTIMIGCLFVESENTSFMSKGGGVRYFSPSSFS